MKKERYSAKQLCAMYRNKYIAEIKFLKAIHKDDYDIIYGDYADYVAKRTSVDIDAFIPLVY